MSPKPVAIVAADTHIDHLIWRSRPEIVYDSFYGFRQLVEASNKKKLPLILAGDCWECLPVNAPSVESLGVIGRFISTLNHPMYYIYGQHDEGGMHDHFSIFDNNNVKRLDYLELGGLKLHGMSWRPKHQLADAQEGIQLDTDVVICHQVWSEGMGGINCEGSIKDMPGQLVISGDYHQFKAAKVVRPDGSKVTFVSPGATHLRKINEPAEHYYLTLFDDCTVKRTKMKSRTVISAELCDEKGFETLYASLPDVLKEAEELAKDLPLALQTPILAISDTSDLPKIESRIKSVVKDRVHLFYNRIATEAPSTLSNQSAPSAQSLAEYAALEIKDDADLAALLLPLFGAEDIQSRIDDYRKLVIGQ